VWEAAADRVQATKKHRVDFRPPLSGRVLELQWAVS
jgi:hypothetical protein